ncbi:MAG: hypothetical protein KGI09_07540 [Thaumarchaeota archaeon]|nr:hypothetical protein [Nitrososphaerota archaeon]
MMKKVMNPILKKSSFDTRFIIKTALAYCILSMAFSFAGIFLAEKGPVPNPVGSLTIQEVAGHFVWGLVAGAVTLSLRYVILTGLFAVLIDSDHIIGLTHIDALVRMSHSISFGIISVLVLMVLFGKRDYRLGAAAMAGLLSHLSFDTFAGDDGKFPIFTPFYNHQISFAHIDWLYFELAAIMLVGIVTIIMKKDMVQKTV